VEHNGGLLIHIPEGDWMRAFLAVLVLALALAGCAEDDAEVRQSTAKDPGTFRAESIPESHIQFVMEGAAVVCEDVGVCFAISDAGGSVIAQEDLGYTGYHQVDPSGFHRISLSPRLFRNMEHWTTDGLRRVSAHEFGHAAGLGHSCDPDDYMWAGPC
jgi:hypothetical protein